MLCLRNMARWTVGRVVAEAKQPVRGDATRRVTVRAQCAGYADATGAEKIDWPRNPFATEGAEVTEEVEYR